MAGFSHENLEHMIKAGLFLANGIDLLQYISHVNSKFSFALKACQMHDNCQF